MDHLCRQLSHQGLIRNTAVQTSFQALRSTEVWLYRLTEPGRQAAAGAQGELRRALVAVAKHEDKGLEGWSDEREVWRSQEIGEYHLWNIRSILKNGVLRGI